MNIDIAAADALLTTTRAVRKRLDFERPVERETIRDCLNVAMQAPTGSNKQNWRWIVVTDQATRATIAKFYRKGVGSYLEEAVAQAQSQGDHTNARVFDSAQFLAERMQDVPVHVLACIELDVSGAPPSHAPIGAMGSIFPAVWSFQLALRARGLGTCLTTLHLKYAGEVAQLLGIPDGIVQVALLPVAYTKGTDFKPAKRRPMDEVVHWDKWG
ncbi:MAG: nitroreductase family protein [Chromatiales bacterium]|jgi:nitroreductase|nr:nitroreductase family protein [Chromatiales bacterium]